MSVPISMAAEKTRMTSRFATPSVENSLYSLTLSSKVWPKRPHPSMNFVCRTWYLNQVCGLSPGTSSLSGWGNVSFCQVSKEKGVMNRAPLRRPESTPRLRIVKTTTLIQGTGLYADQARKDWQALRRRYLMENFFEFTFCKSSETPVFTL